MHTRNCCFRCEGPEHVSTYAARGRKLDDALLHLGDDGEKYGPIVTTSCGRSRKVEVVSCEYHLLNAQVA